MMRDELVRRRGWVSDERFVDLMGTTNLIPGPNSTELAIHLGFDRARWRGLFAAGASFILPAAVMVTVLAWAYVRYGDTPAVEGVLYGIVPAVIAIIAYAILGLLRTVIKGVGTGVLGAAALAAYLLGSTSSSCSPLAPRSRSLQTGSVDGPAGTACTAWSSRRCSP